MTSLVRHGESTILKFTSFSESQKIMWIDGKSKHDTRLYSANSSGMLLKGTKRLELSGKKDQNLYDLYLKMWLLWRCQIVRETVSTSNDSYRTFQHGSASPSYLTSEV